MISTPHLPPSPFHNPRHNASLQLTRLHATMSFVPRTSFAIPSSVPKTYFLGHHAAGANKIKTLMSSIALVLECRDFRLPLSTQNQTLERAVSGRERLIVYTKTDLGSDSLSARNALRKLYGDRNVVFWDKNRPSTTEALLRRLKRAADTHDSLTGMRALVVGMPNVGKSTLLNALRSAGTVGKTRKAAKTGDQAGVTRKVGTAVRVVDADVESGSAGVYVLDTPGIFTPYVDDGETMVKVALAHGIKKGLIQDHILADYLLYRLNMWDPSLYARYCEPTNDVDVLLAAVAARDGKLKAGGVPNWHEAAARLLSQWRDGKLGRYILDDLDEQHVRAHQTLLAEPQVSLSQAKKMAKESRKQERVGN